MSILGGGSYKLRSFFVVSAVSSVLLECDDWDAATAECSDDDDEWNVLHCLVDCIDGALRRTDGDWCVASDDIVVIQADDELMDAMNVKTNTTADIMLDDSS